MREQVRILLIEDSATYAHLTRSMLVEIDGTPVEWLWADRVAAGLERLSEGDIDLILLDLVLPDSRGLDTFVRVHAHAPDVPIVVLSSLEEESLAAQIIQQGAQDYLVKDWMDSRLLGRSIRYALERHRLQARLTAQTQALRLSEERHRSLLENVPVAIVTYAADARIVFSNPAACELLDLTEEQMLGREGMDPRWCFLGEDGSSLPVEEYPVAQVISTNRPLREAVYGIVRPTKGDTVWVLVSADPIRDAQDKIAEVVTTFVDITELRQAEEQLWASEIRFRGLFGHMSSGCAVYRAEEDGQDFVFVDLNQAGEQIDQVRRDDLISRSVTEVFPDVKVFGLLDVFQRVWRTGQPEHHPIALYRDERVSGWRENYVFRLPSGEVVALYDDVTERKQAEEALRQSEERYRTLFETMPQGVVYQDAGGQITSTNPAAERILGLTLDQMQGRTSIDPLWKSIHEDGSDFPGDTHPAMVALETGQEVRDVTMGVYNPQHDEYRWINVSASPQFRPGENQPYQVYATFDDITERKHGEEALRVQRDLAVALNQTRDLSEALDALLEGLFQLEEFDSGGVYLLDEQTGDVVLTVHANLPEQFTAQVSRFDRDTPQWQLVIKGEPFYQHASGFSPEIAKALESESIKALALIPLKYGGKVIGAINLASHTHDEISEESQNITWSIANLVGATISRAQAGQQLKQYRERLEDLVEERTAELSLRVAEVEQLNQGMANLLEDLQTANRVSQQRARSLLEVNAELETFAYSVSHDLRAPLRAINGFAQIIAHRHRDDLNEQAQHYFDNIIQASTHMDQLIDDLLRYARLGRQAVRWQAVSLAGLLAQVTSNLAGRLAQLDAQLSLPPADELPVLNSDPTLLGQVLTNLLDNALSYHQPGTTPQVSVSCAMKGTITVISVADRGIGIAPEFHDKIFAIFQRLHAQEQYPGTGIGLAIVKKAVALLGGRVWVESVLGEGSTFYVELPERGPR